MKTSVFFPFLMAVSAISNIEAHTETGPLEKVISDFYQTLDSGDMDQVADLFSPDALIYLPFSPNALDVATYRQVGIGFKAGFPDMHHQVIEVTETGNAIAYKGIFSGTNSGAMQGNPPTGNRVESPFLGYVKFGAGGKITELNIQFDMAAFNAQLMQGLPNPQESLKQMAGAIMQNLDQRNLDDVLAYFAPDARFTGWGPETLGLNGYRQTMSGLLAAFPDSHFTVDEIIAEGSKVSVRHHLEGTHTGAPFQQVPVSNRKVYVNAVVTFDIREGKIAEAWLNADFLGMLMQLGAIPAN